MLCIWEWRWYHALTVLGSLITAVSQSAFRFWEQNFWICLSHCDSHNLRKIYECEQKVSSLTNGCIGKLLNCYRIATLRCCRRCTSMTVNCVSVVYQCISWMCISCVSMTVNVEAWSRTGIYLLAGAHCVLCTQCTVNPVHTVYCVSAVYYAHCALCTLCTVPTV